jgi:hypothetical protein
MELKSARSPIVQLVSLWIGPLAAATDLMLSYSLVQHACSTGHHYVLHAITIVCFLIALSGAPLAWKEYQTVRNSDDEGGTSINRTYFLSIMGLASSIGFAVVIVALAVPRFILSPCQ